jgi:hypothetical protein
MVGHPDDRFTFETGCSAIYDVRREPNDRLGVRCISTPDPEVTPQGPTRSAKMLPVGPYAQSLCSGHCR